MGTHSCILGKGTVPRGSTCAFWRGARGSSYGGELRKSVVTFWAESDSSLLMVSLGSPPSDEQEALAPSFSPGKANALQ